MAEFTTLEIQLIKSSLTTKSDGEIAAILERPIEEVHGEINRITAGQAEARSNAIQSRREEIFSRKQQQERQVQELAAAKKQAREEAISRQLQKSRERQERIQRRETVLRERAEKKKLAEEKKSKSEKEYRERSSRIHNEHLRQAQRSQRESRRVFKTRDLELDKMISVRIDRKTLVFVKPGTDIEKVKKFYQKKVLATSL